MADAVVAYADDLPIGEENLGVTLGAGHVENVRLRLGGEVFEPEFQEITAHHFW
jgi:hypothetical protein